MRDVERADDRGQQIVEVVRDAARELAHGFELLRLPQRLLRLLQFLCLLFQRCDVATIAIQQISLA